MKSDAVAALGKRLRAACRTSDVQVEAVCVLSVLNIMAAVHHDGSPLWLIIFTALFWPTLAFIANFLSPIPKNNQ